MTVLLTANTREHNIRLPRALICLLVQVWKNVLAQRVASFLFVLPQLLPRDCDALRYRETLVHPERLLVIGYEVRVLARTILMVR